MTHSAVRRGPRAFTLVELLIVITIVGILAAVAIPQFGDSSTDAKIAALDQNLACIRSAIELYHYQHNGTYPGTIAGHSSTAGGVERAHASAAEAFEFQMTYYSNAGGHTCAEKDSSYPYGPYLRKGVPDNPLPAGTATGNADSVNVTTDTTSLSADAKPATGWKASSETGEFIANNSQYESR
jgi:general secretion pathway protein G